MKIKPGWRVALDTNVLLDATDESRSLHTRALAVFQELPRQGADLVLGTQVLREYLVVATRPEKNNGLGLSVEDAVGNARQFRSCAALIPETVEASELLARWALQFQVTGKKLHDLQLLATLHQAGVPSLVTSNPDDFPKDTGVHIALLAELEMG